MDIRNLSPAEKEKYLEYLSSFITAKRRKKIREVVQERTRYLTLVLENIYQPHNASAVLRSCECFGILDVHIIDDVNKYQVNPDVALGSAQWLNLIYYHEPQTDNTRLCLNGLKLKGYTIVAATPHKNNYTPEDLPLNNKIALVFGTELTGLSEQALSLADCYMQIPMVGFTESLNISVSAAISLYILTQRLRRSDVAWQLSEEEKTETEINWIKNSIKKAEAVEKNFFKSQNIL